jgi:hypothetical protein
MPWQFSEPPEGAGKYQTILSTVDGLKYQKNFRKSPCPFQDKPGAICETCRARPRGAFRLISP